MHIIFFLHSVIVAHNHYFVVHWCCCKLSLLHSYLCCTSVLLSIDVHFCCWRLYICWCTFVVAHLLLLHIDAYAHLLLLLQSFVDAHLFFVVHWCGCTLFLLLHCIVNAHLLLSYIYQCCKVIVATCFFIHCFFFTSFLLHTDVAKHSCCCTVW